MSSQETNDFISNSLKNYNLDPSRFDFARIPDIMDLMRQNFNYTLGPTNPAFLNATLSYEDVLVWSYTLQHNPNGVLWRVNAAGRPHPDDYYQYLEQNRILQRTVERTRDDIQSKGFFELNAENVKQTPTPEVQSTMLDRYRNSERVTELNRGYLSQTAFWGMDLGSRVAPNQYEYCTSNGYVFTDISQAQPGDLVFFQNTYGDDPPGTVTHVGIYAGKGEMIHAGSTHGVCYDNVTSQYWQKFFKAFGRVRK